jgi:hypothetical protein
MQDNKKLTGIISIATIRVRNIGWATNVLGGMENEQGI